MTKFLITILFSLNSFALNNVQQARLGISNINYLANPGFETGTHGWTASGGTLNGLGAKQFGVGGGSWDSDAAAQTLSANAILTTDFPGLQRNSGLFSCYIKAVSGTATHNLVVSSFAGTYTQAITSSTDGARTNLYFPFSGSGQSLVPRIDAVAANEPIIYIDDCYFGLADRLSVSAISDHIVYSGITFGATTTAPTKASAPIVDRVVARRVGGYLEGVFEYKHSTNTGSANGSGDYLFTIPAASACVIDTTRVTAFATTGNINAASNTGSAFVTNGSTTAIGVPTVFDSTRLRVHYIDSGGNLVGAGNYAMASAAISYQVNFKVPCVGWSASQSAAAANQTDYGWTSYVPTFTGFGTVTSPECQHRRTKENLDLRCKFTTGTSTAVEARVSLPNNLTSAAVGVIPSIQINGFFGRGAASANTMTVLTEPSVGYFTFSSNTAGTNPLTKANGNAVLSTGETGSFYASVPITGWAENQRAPTLIGSVTSNAVSALRSEWARVTSAGVVTELGGSDWISGSCAVASNTFTCTLVANAFSSAPVCNVLPTSGSADFVFGASAASFTTTSIAYSFTRPGAGNFAVDHMVSCTGPR